MQKPQYELVPLREAVIRCRANILAFQGAISKEENKIDELQGYIRQWEEYNEHTGEPTAQSENNHDTRG